MASFTADQLARIGAADELQIASRRADGTLRPFATIWCVRSGDDIYIRSAYGPENPWYRRALASGRGRIRAGGVEADVTLEVADAGIHDDLDVAYHSKYDHYGPRIVGTVVGMPAASTTLRLTPDPRATPTE